jgi:hypothetical protein
MFSDELFQFLADRRLEAGRMYRVDRHDVMGDFPANGLPGEQLAYCRSHVARVCAREGTFPVDADGLRHNEDPDIVRPGSAIRFAGGWYPVERYGSDQPFRWMGNQAEIVLQVPEGGGFLTLEVEPGPGMPALPQPLHVIDEQGRVAAEWEITGRDTLELLVPLPAGGRRIRLALPGAGEPVLSDPRILNLRVFRCEWAEFQQHPSVPGSTWQAMKKNRRILTRLLGRRVRTRGPASAEPSAAELMRRAARLLSARGSDIFDCGMEYRLLDGFFELQEVRGERYRRIDREAQIAFRSSGEGGCVEMLVEPAAGVERFELVVHAGNSSEVARIPVSGLTMVAFPLAAAPGDLVRLRLTAESEGPAGTAGRDRTTYRLFAFGIGASSCGPPGPDSVVAGWWCRTVASRRRELDWTGISEDDRKMATAMGRPEVLHINGCGDFTLMARQHWHDLRGYAELDRLSTHLDSLLCYAAHHAGVKELVLPEPMRCYYIGHEAGSDSTPEGVPAVSYDDLVKSIAQMRILHAPIIFNMDRWGLAGVDLAEVVPAAGGTTAKV